ncbi:hypothetical protein CANINC_003119 [Pichia inconspicua]|uniref:Cytochrome b5 heme-binding domain-containing protein n=1 Tax=Pichia inconspicua TaxID=52247 RepID=A0A4T0X0X6_9ASCO|nr:hypothetical protein CANINC_003119 [[Candida] inconspicua]
MMDSSNRPSIGINSKPMNHETNEQTEMRLRRGYDFRTDYKFNSQEDIEFDYSHNTSLRKRVEYNYTLTSPDSWIAKILLFIGFIRIKKVRSKHKHKERKKKNVKLDIKAKRILEQQHLERLDSKSSQYRILTQDKSKLKVITKNELSKHIIPSSSRINKIKLELNKNWMLIHGFVFDTSAILDSHPGGVECLLDCVGVDATRVFDDVGHSDIAWEMLENQCVGVFEDYVGDIDDLPDNNDNCTCGCNGEIIIRDKYIWCDKIIEYAFFIFLSIISLLSFIYVQRKKWE